jgi:hypothetical protein
MLLGMDRTSVQMYGRYGKAGEVEEGGRKRTLIGKVDEVE